MLSKDQDTVLYVFLQHKIQTKIKQQLAQHVEKVILCIFNSLKKKHLDERLNLFKVTTRTVALIQLFLPLEDLEEGEPKDNSCKEPLGGCYFHLPLT